jgi:hypothetical protein
MSVLKYNEQREKRKEAGEEGSHRTNRGTLNSRMNRKILYAAHQLTGVLVIERKNGQLCSLPMGLLRFEVMSSAIPFFGHRQCRYGKEVYCKCCRVE